MAFIFTISCCQSNPSSISLKANTKTCTRRSILQRSAISGLGAVLSTLLPDHIKMAEAASLRDNELRRLVKQVSLSGSKANALKDIVASYPEKFNEDDTLYVLRYIPIWLEPGRAAMAEYAKSEAATTDEGILAGQLMGHVLELKQDAKAGDRNAVIMEIDEFVETTDKFLGIANVKKFEK